MIKGADKIPYKTRLLWTQCYCVPINEAQPVWYLSNKAG